MFLKIVFIIYINKNNMYIQTSHTMVNTTRYEYRLYINTKIHIVGAG